MPARLPVPPCQRSPLPPAGSGSGASTGGTWAVRCIPCVACCLTAAAAAPRPSPPLQVAPVVKSAVDVAAPVVEKGVRTAVDVATPVVQVGGGTWRSSWGSEPAAHAPAPLSLCLPRRPVQQGWHRVLQPASCSWHELHMTKRSAPPQMHMRATAHCQACAPAPCRLPACRPGCSRPRRR